MIRFLVLLAAVLAASIVTAAEKPDQIKAAIAAVQEARAIIASVNQRPPVVLSLPSGGTYVLSYTDAGAPQITGPVSVVTPGGVTTPPSDPPPTGGSDVQKAIQAAAAAATADPQRAVTAANLSSLMGLMQSQVDAGTVKEYKTIAAATNWMFDQATQGRQAAWKPAKDLIGQHLMALAQKGSQPSEYSGYFVEAGKGFTASVPASQMEDVENDPQRFNIENLMRLFEFFIKYILPLIMGGIGG